MSIANSIKFCEVTQCRDSDSHVTSQHLCPKCKNRGHGIIECGDEDLIKAYVNLKDKKMPRFHHCKHPECSMSWTHSTSYHKCEYCNLNHSISKCPDILEVEKNITIKCPICRKYNIIKSNQQNVFNVEDKCIVCLEKNANIFLPTCGHVCICNECAEKMDTSCPVNILKSNEIPHDVLECARYNMLGMIGKIYTVIYEGNGTMYYIKKNGITDEPRGFKMTYHNWGGSTKELDCRTDLYRFIHNYRYIKGF